MLIRKYGDNLNRFQEKLIQQDEIAKIANDLRLADTVAVAVSASSNKKGNQRYNKWRQKKIWALKEKQREDTMTVFEKVRKSKGSNTLFDRFRALGKKHGI